MRASEIILEFARPNDNSLGRPIAGSPEAIANFWQWFGASKIVDRQGRPIVVHHGTTSHFFAFDPHMSNSNTNTGVPKGAFVFSNSHETAASYAGQKTKDWGFENPADEKEYKRLLLTVKDIPGALEFSKKHMTQNVKSYEEGGNVMPVYLKVKKLLKINAKGDYWRDIYFNGEPWTTNELMSYAQEQGYDGLLIRNVKDRQEGNMESSDTYVVFSPTQIKSAIGNRGSYHPDKPEIDEEAGAMREIKIDELPKDVQTDLCGWIADHNPLFPTLQSIHDELFGLVNAPTVRIGDVPVSSLISHRINSSTAVQNYAKKLRDNPSLEFHPILVSNGKFLDGGHRLEAYALAGRKIIPVVEVGHIVNASAETWQRWMDGDEVTFEAAPTIASATMKNGEINRKTANRMVDPRGYFKPKAPLQEETGATVMLYHGTCADNAAAICQNGWNPGSGQQGGNAGQARYLYLTTEIEDAEWFANEKGCTTVLAVNAPLAFLIVDPEDGIGDTVQDELNSMHGLPGKVALTRPLGPEHFQIIQS